MRRLAAARRSPHAGRDRWLVSYADFMTLLFAFFATMYAISSVDARKLTRVASALQEAFDASASGPVSGQAGAAGRAAARDQAATSTEPPPEAGAGAARRGADASSAAMARAMSSELAAELGGDRLQVFVDQRGVTLSIPEAGTFAVGRDEVSADAQALIGRIALTLGRFPNPVRVEGHTDDVPIHNLRFQSNWDLSAARASRVVELLIDKGLAADRLSATGYGEFHPRVPNESAAARAQNRRIDLVVLNAAATSAEEPAHPASTP